MIRALCVFCVFIAMLDTFCLFLVLMASGKESRREEEMMKKEVKDEDD